MEDETTIASDLGDLDNLTAEETGIQIPEEKKVDVPTHPVVDYGDNETDILIRYDHIYRALVNTPDWKVDASCEKDSVVDWSLAFAYEGGEDYFARLHWHMNMSIVRAAVLLVSTMVLFLYPPRFATISRKNYCMTAIGIAAVAELCSIVSYIIFSACCDRPHGYVDAMISRVKHHVIYISGMFFEAKGVLTLAGALIMARGDGDVTVGIAACVAASIIVLTMWLWTLLYTDQVQADKLKAFYKQYLNPATGMLKDEVMARVFLPPDVPTFLEIIGQFKHLDRFQGLTLDEVLKLDKEDLMELFEVGRAGSRKESAEERQERLVLQADVRFIADKIQRARRLQPRM
jgi:hypothetical protein